jgi:hypothetical protein
MGLEPVGQREGVRCVPLGAQRQRFDAEQQLLGGKRVQAGAQVAQNLDAYADGEGDAAEGLPELEPVVAGGGLDELREAVGVLAPVELAGVDDEAANGGAVAADPFLGPLAGVVQGSAGDLQSPSERRYRHRA